MMSTTIAIAPRRAAATLTPFRPLAAWFNDADNRNRLRAGAGVVLFHALLLYVLAAAFGVRIVPGITDEVKLFNVREDTPPPAARPAPPREAKARKPRAPHPEGAASPRNLQDTPSEVVAPKPQLPMVPPLPAAPIEGQGRQAAAGASALPGPGTGSGGIGNGAGSGAAGDGTGGGGGGGAAGPEWIRGSIDNDDYPRDAWRAGAEGKVFIRFVVGTNGRVTQCDVTRSSGRRDLDQTTCDLIMRRFRYRPARDAAGRPVPATIGGDQEWGGARQARQREEEEARRRAEDDDEGPDQ